LKQITIICIFIVRRLMLTCLFCVKVRTCGRVMGMTIGAMLEEIQTLYQQHKQSCFLYLSSEVIKVDLYFQKVE
jgi:transportin-3